MAAPTKPRLGLIACLVGALLGSTVGVRAAPATAALRQALDGDACRALGDFYWEIGDAKGLLQSGQQGSRYTAASEMAIASASKWLFGAFVVERSPGALSSAQIDALTMRSGYDSMHPLACKGAETARECWQRRGNSKLDAQHVGRFSYNGAHDEKLLIDMGLGDLERPALAAELRHTLGEDLALSYSIPDPAGGVRTTASDYARFLRKILNGQLRISAELGSHAVCTLPGRCADAVHSPVPAAWHYSLNHWVEDGAQGDGAFSSTGAFGFYPWISADKRYYGILARESWRRQAGVDSAACGAQLRRAFMAGGG